MFLQDKVIKHKRSMDVCFYIIKSYSFDDHTRMVVRTINLGFVESWIINKDTISIKHEDLKDWEVCCERDVDCYRNTRWREIK